MHPGEQHFARVLVREADAVERDPGQHHRDEQEQRGDELGRARAGRRRLVVPVRRMIVMTACARVRWRGVVRARDRCVIAPGAGLPPGWRARAPASEMSAATMQPSSGRKTMA